MGLDTVMVVRTQRVLTPEEVKQTAVRMQIAFGRASGSGVLWVNAKLNEHSLELVDDNTVRLNTLARYYGPGYERGDLVGILAVARYLRDAFAPCEVYYGSDCDDEPSLLDAEREAELWKHFTGGTARAYFAGGGLRAEGTVICDFCDVRTNAHTFCGREVTSTCPSCGQSWHWNGALAVKLPERR